MRKSLDTCFVQGGGNEEVFGCYDSETRRNKKCLKRGKVFKYSEKF